MQIHYKANFEYIYFLRRERYITVSSLNDEKIGFQNILWDYFSLYILSLIFKFTVKFNLNSFSYSCLICGLHTFLLNISLKCLWCRYLKYLIFLILWSTSKGVSLSFILCDKLVWTIGFNIYVAKNIKSECYDTFDCNCR